MIRGLSALAASLLVFAFEPLAATATPQSNPSTATPVLQAGSGYHNLGVSERVRLLQRSLALVGDPVGPIDGDYGPGTERAIRRFQAADGLPVDGIAGPRTLAALAMATATATVETTPSGVGATTTTTTTTTATNTSTRELAGVRPAHRRTSSTTTGWLTPIAALALGLLLAVGWSTRQWLVDLLLVDFLLVDGLTAVPRHASNGKRTPTVDLAKPGKRKSKEEPAGAKASYRRADERDDTSGGSSLGVLREEQNELATPAPATQAHDESDSRWAAWARNALRPGLIVPLVFIAMAAVLGSSLDSGQVLYLVYISLSLVLGAVATTTLVWMLHAWRTPNSLAESRLGSNGLSTAHSFSLIVPARHEETVLEVTLSRLIKSDHPAFEVLVVVGADDPDTRNVADRVAGRYPDLVKVVVDASWPKSKPKALNAALPHCTGSITGVFDAEDDVHPALLRRVDQCLQKTEADVVQAGVQLMNFRSSWLTVRNVLEYYFWFRSRLHLHARQRFIPLGGNTVFVRTQVLRAVGGWDPECLAEDCELGVRLSAFGAHTAVFYEPELVTREECPPTLGAFVRQRTRWNQGYLQTLSRGYWRQLPVQQRVLGVYILAMPYVLALAWLMFPVAIVTAVAVKAPIGITLFSFLPALPMVSMLTAEIAGLSEFCRAYGEHASARDYARLILGLPLYQFVLAFSAARAVTREARGVKAWEKTEHLGLHLAGQVAEPPAPSQVSVSAQRRSTVRAPDSKRHSGVLVPAIAFASTAGVAPVTRLLGGLDSRPLWTRLHPVSLDGSAAVSRPAIPRFEGVEAALRWLRAAARIARSAAASRTDLVVQVVLLTLVATVLATNALHWPNVQFDEGTYVGNAWAVQHGKLAPYTYSYGHPPLAWLLIFLWTSVGGLFGRTSFSLDVGRQFMVVVSIVSCSLLYALARRLTFGRAAACAAVILFALSPVSIFFHRAVLLDNPSTAWALAAFLLARSPERRLWAFAGSGACFAASVLCKETSVVLLPALIFAAAQNMDRATRRYCGTLFVSLFALIAMSYPLYATLKGELLPGRGHVSLIGYALVQLVTRKGTGSLFHAHSQTHEIVTQWLHLDPWLLGVALALSPIAIARRSTRPVALAFLIQVVMILRPGYLPNMYVIGLLPFAALIVSGSVEAIYRSSRRTTHWLGTFVLVPCATVAALVLVTAVGGRWMKDDALAMKARMDAPTRAAQRWLTHHVGRDQRLIVGDEFYVYLIQHGFNHQPVKGGFFSKTVVSYWPLDYDPAVKRQFPHGWQDFTYIVSTQAMLDTKDQTPTAASALTHSTVVVSFGRGTQQIEIRRIMAQAR